MRDPNEMTLAEIVERLAQLDTEVRETQDMEVVKAATDEKKLLLERKAELEEIEARTADAAALEAGEVKPEEIIETREEIKPMEINYREAWLKNLMGIDMNEEERAAITESAAVIPTETLNKIVVLLQENPILSKIDLLQIPGYVRIPVYSVNNDAAWTSTASDSADVVSYIDLKPFQLIKTLEISADVKAMAIPAFETWLVRALANKIESALQKAVIVGSGAASSQPTGIITTVATATGTFTAAACTKADLLKIMAALDSGYQQNASWIMPAEVFYKEVMAIADHNTFVNLEDGMKKMLFGHEVILDDNCVDSDSADNILYGDLNHYHMNLGEGVNVAKDDSIGFRSNSRIYRGVCQADGQLDLAAAFVRFYRAS